MTTSILALRADGDFTQDRDGFQVSDLSARRRGEGKKQT